jgi:hypothetical protein
MFKASDRLRIMASSVSLWLKPVFFVEVTKLPPAVTGTILGFALGADMRSSSFDKGRIDV